MTSVTLDGEKVMFRTKDGASYTSIKPQGEEVTDRLIAKDVDVRAEPQEQSGFMSLLGRLASVHTADRRLDLLHEPDAGRR